MATFQTRSFQTIVSNIAAGMQGRVGSFLNFAAGSVFLAISEAFAGVTLWLQGLILQDAMLSRLSTSFGFDVDSWLADFGITTRIGSVAATGQVVFSRIVAAASAPVVLIGTTVKTLDGKQAFRVYVDATNPAYSATAGGYVMPAQVASLVVPVVSVTPSLFGTVLPDGTRSPGANGNVSAGAISLIASQVPGIDKVTNPAAFTNGSDQESDAAVKPRFRKDLQGLSKGTVTAIESAVGSVQTGLQVKVRNGEALDGALTPGFVSVIVDDGSGSISSALLAQCQDKAFATVAGGVRMGVFAGQRVLVGVEFTLSVLPGYTRQVVAAKASAAVAALINGSGLGNGIDYFGIGTAARMTPGVAKIDDLLVNGGIADIAPDPRYTLKCSGVVVN